MPVSWQQNWRDCGNRCTPIGAGSFGFDHSLQFGVVEFRHLVAVVANQELTDMPTLGERTAHICVQGFDFMGQAVFQQKVQGAIHRRRLGVVFFPAQLLEQGICGHRPVAGPDQFQHPPADAGEADALAAADLLGPRHGRGDAVAVVMAGGAEGGGGGHGIDA